MTPSMTVGVCSCLSGAAGGEPRTEITVEIGGENAPRTMYFGMTEVVVAPEDIDDATVDFSNGEGVLPLRDFLTLSDDGYWYGEVSNYKRVQYTEAGTYTITVKGARSINFTKTFHSPGQATAIVVEDSARIVRFFSNDPRLVEIPSYALFFAEILEEFDVSKSGVASIGGMAFAFLSGATVRLPPNPSFSFAADAFSGGENLTLHLPVPKAGFVASESFPYGMSASTWHFSDGDEVRE